MSTQQRRKAHTLTEGSQGVAVVSSVSGEACAQTRGVVALASAAALVGIVVRQAQLSGVGLGKAVASLEVQTVNLGCASGSALVVLDDDHVLRALDGRTGEGDVHQDLSGGVAHGGSDGDAIDDSVGKIQQSELNIVD